jgi:glycosyltransferase involved in cell wall biosynthesis
VNRRVGVVATSFVPGGAERYLLDLYGAGGPGSWSATLIGSIPGWDATGLPTVADLKVGPKWSRSRFRREPHHVASEMISLRRHVGTLGRTREFELFHCQYKREQIGLSPSLARHAPVVWTEHGTSYRGKGASLLRFGYRKASRSVKVIACVGKEVAADVSAICSGAGPEVVVIPNAVDTEIFRPAVNEIERSIERTRFDPAGVLGDLPLAVVTSRLHPDKRLDRLVEAAAAAGIGLIIAGSGPDEARLRRLAAERPVLFAGHLPSADVAALLRAADLYLFSAMVTGEGAPLSVLEALATGLGIAAFKGDIGASTVEDAGGLLIEGPTDLKEAWQGLVTAEVRAHARSYAEGRGYGPWREQYANLFDRVVAG